MHLASEVSSTSGPGPDVGPPPGALSAELLAERTLDGLMAEHPGELVRTGCPHVVREFTENFETIHQKLKINQIFL